MQTVNISRFLANVGIDFRDVRLAQQSLTHPSFVNEHPETRQEDNQRLEFLGDAVIDFLSGEWLYGRFPDASEGYLTRLRAALVRTERLAGFADHISIGDTLLLGRGEEENGGRRRPANLCAAFEAFVGGLYLDQGLVAARAFAVPFFEPALEEILRLELDKDPKSVLQEWCQAHLGATPTYQTVSTTGPDHAKEFTVAVLVGDRLLGEGSGRNKQRAAQMAAQNALERLQSAYSSARS